MSHLLRGIGQLKMPPANKITQTLGFTVWKVEERGKVIVLLLRYAIRERKLELIKTPNSLKRECPLRPSHIENMWHMMKNQNFSYSSQR